MIEYVLILSVMAFTLMAAMPLFSDATGRLYNRISGAVTNTP